MTVEQIIKQTETLTKDQKQQVAFYILFSNMSEDKRNNLMQLFFYENNEKSSKNNENPKEKPILGMFKGMVEYMADDFDAPLDDLKDYMY